MNIWLLKNTIEKIEIPIIKTINKPEITTNHLSILNFSFKLALVIEEYQTANSGSIFFTRSR